MGRRRRQAEVIYHDPKASSSGRLRGIHYHSTKIYQRLLPRHVFIAVVVITLWFWLSSPPFIESEVSSISKEEACRGYKGILHIAQGDKEGAAATIFFLFVTNQILYAHKHNLIPWIHLSNASHHIYDPTVHGGSRRLKTLWVRDILKPSWAGFRDPISDKSFGFPGSPKWNTTIQKAEFPTARLQSFTIAGNGVWNDYFYPLSDFSPEDPSCQRLPLVRLSYPQIIPGLHLHCPWALRAWRYGGLPPSLRRDDLSYNEWFRPMRQRGTHVVQRNVRFRPTLQKQAHEANPSPNCLAMHVRHSDKANRRQRIPLSRFLPYIDAYLEQVPNGKIYIATDSSNAIQELQGKPHYQGRLLWQNDTLRSSDTTAVFRMTTGHHSTNVQVLVDILAMSKCQFLLHGLSAVSEAVLYLQPNLQDDGHSINLELSRHASVRDFQHIIRRNYGLIA